MDMRHFNEGINSVGNCKIKNAVLDMFDSFKDEKKNVNEKLWQTH